MGKWADRHFDIKRQLTKVKFIIFLSLLSLTSFGQKDFVEIKGTVYAFTMLGKDTLPLKNADIFLKINDSIIIKQTTDIAGQYKFQIKTTNLVATLYAQSTNKTFNKANKQYCFMADGDKKKIDLSKRKIFIADFQFKQFTDCYDGVLPELLFEQNSIIPLNFGDSLLNINSTLRDFPLLTIQINGHADNKEINCDQLSLKRAQFIYDELIKLGIDKNRLTIKGFGSTRPLISEDIIKRAKTKEEKAALRQRNSRLTFQALTFGIE